MSFSVLNFNSGLKRHDPGEPNEIGVFSFAVNISCAVGGNDCGQINVTLGPMEL